MLDAVIASAARSTVETCPNCRELPRTAALSVVLGASLLVFVIGLAAAVEVPRPDWALLVVGGALSVVGVVALTMGRRRRRRKTRSSRPSEAA